ncbi:hypothetical protein [Runella zeae]|uniref:hypothetical protein n=3 Tax=Runella zeae TaxID=94255 RepID=UPI002356DEC6|nr:hypothetical protein [Runella zeae]
MNREDLNYSLDMWMDEDLRFFSPFKQSIEITKECFIRVCEKKWWPYGIDEKPFDEKYYGWCKRVEPPTREEISLVIDCSDYTLSWFEDKEHNPKAHISNDCHYIIHFIFCHDREFMLDFAIAFLEENPTSYAETLWFNNDTYFDEYTLADLYEIKRLGYANNWAWYRRGKPDDEPENTL